MTIIIDRLVNVLLPYVTLRTRSFDALPDLGQ